MMEDQDDYAYLLEMLDAEEINSMHGNYSLEDFLRVTMDYEQEDHWFQTSEELCFIFLIRLLQHHGPGRQRLGVLHHHPQRLQTVEPELVHPQPGLVGHFYMRPLQTSDVGEIGA